MRISAKKLVHAKYQLPFGFGVAYWEYDRPEAVCYPIPFHLIVRFFRWGYHQLVLYRPTKLDGMLREAYDRGHNDTKNGKYVDF
jgi:hypothetical protein